MVFSSRNWTQKKYDLKLLKTTECTISVSTSKCKCNFSEKNSMTTQNVARSLFVKLEQVNQFKLTIYILVKPWLAKQQNLADTLR
jgi:hypothetical protein